MNSGDFGPQESTVDEVNKWKDYGGLGKFFNVASRGAEIMHFGEGCCAAWPFGSGREDILMRIMDGIYDTWDFIIG